MLNVASVFTYSTSEQNIHWKTGKHKQGAVNVAPTNRIWEELLTSNVTDWLSSKYKVVSLGYRSVLVDGIGHLHCVILRFSIINPLRL